MSRLTDKITATEKAISELEDQLDDLHAKQKRGSFRRDRKSLRRRLSVDPIFRATQLMMRQMERDMYYGRD